MRWDLPDDRVVLPGGRALFLLALLIFAIDLGQEIGREPPLRGIAAKFPELRDVDPRIERELKTVWVGNSLIQDESKSANLREIATGHGIRGAWALFKLLVQDYARRPHGSDAYGYPDADETWACAADTLGGLADDGLRACLVRALKDPELHVGLRRQAVIALCRPRHSGALEPLLDRALERHEKTSCRKAILLRLHRLEVSAPEELRQLLYLPFADLDYVAAGTLARMGDHEAPTMVRDGLRRLWWESDASSHLAKALNRITGEEVRFPENPPAGLDSREWQRRRGDRVAGILQRWLDAHPEALDTEFERRRRDWAGSDRRRRALALKSLDDVVDSGEDFDLASASVLLTDYEDPVRARVLDSLDRLAWFIEPRLAGAAGPEEKIAVLNEWLLRRGGSVDFYAHRSGAISYLPKVLSQDHGNCLGYSTLYLALADRLGLPLRAVLVPRHCFVRWDDGSFLRNIETTAGGTATDAQYAGEKELPAGTPEFFLPSVTRRALLAQILVNYNETLGYRDRFEEMATNSERVLELDRRNVGARLQHAMAVFHSRLDGDDRIRADLVEALHVAGDDPEILAQAAEFHLAMGEPEIALRYTEQALEQGRRADFVSLRMRCLARLGRAAEALEEAAREPDDADAAALLSGRLVAGIYADPGRAVELARATGEGSGDSLSAFTTAAEVLLELAEERPGAAARALELLDAVRSVAGREWKQAFLDSGGAADPDEFFPVRQRWLLIRARVLHALGRREEAERDLGKAREIGGPNRLMLEVEAVLRDG